MPPYPPSPPPPSPPPPSPPPLPTPVLKLDPAYSNPSIGYWQDLTGRGNDMGVYGGVTYSSDFGGILSFNGQSTYAYRSSLVPGTITSTWTGQCRQLAVFKALSFVGGLVPHI